MINKEFIKDFPVIKLKNYGRNPRKNDHAVVKLAESISRVGNNDPIEVDEDFVILAGHTRKKAIENLGMDKTDVVVISGMTEEQKNEYRITNNKIGEIAEWDFQILEEDFEPAELKEYGFAIQEKINFEEDIEVKEKDNYYLTFLTTEEEREFVLSKLNLIDGETQTERLIKICKKI